MTFCEKIFVSQYQKLLTGIFLLSENFLDKMGEGSITVF